MNTVVIKSNSVAFFDVDETLVLWNLPSDVDVNKLLKIGTPDFTQTVLPHEGHITQLKRHKARGHAVVVWSQGGYEWASAVVKALNLQDFVDLIIRKPTWYWDDLPSEEFMGKRAYMELAHK